MIKQTYVTVALAIVVFSLLAGSGETAPSFSCEGDLSGTERLVCANGALSSEDLMLSATYRHALEMAAILPIDKVKVQQEQREWLKSRPRLCQVPPNTEQSGEVGIFNATVCLWDLYRNRRAQLNKVMNDADREFRHLAAEPPEQSSIESITDAGRLAEIAQHFQSAGLDRFFGKTNPRIESCDGAIGYVVQGSGRDSSFAAHCRVRVHEADLHVLMCDDDMVGKFAIQLSPESPTREDVARFVKADCPPGG